MTYRLEAIHPDALDVPVITEVASEDEAVRITQVFADAGCSTSWWPIHGPVD